MSEPIGTALCGWDDIPDPACCPAWETIDPATRVRAKRWAAYLLWAATGRQLGRCETRLRPCRTRCGNDWPPRCSGAVCTAGPWMAAITGAAATGWGGAACGCRRGDTCSCDTVCRVELPGVAPEPVRVTVDGQDIPLDVFRVDNGHWLVWERPCVPACCPCGPDGDPDPDCTRCALTCFPACQDLSKPADCAGTWEITYLHGAPVPEEGLWAAGELACEIAKACAGAGPGECRLPSNVVSMTRGGVEFQFANTGEVTNSSGRVLRFNIPIVDMWVAAVNPYNVTGPVAFYSPDVDYGRVQTWP